MKVGQPAEVVADIYGGSVTYHGKVAGLGGGTGSAMAYILAIVTFALAYFIIRTVGRSL